MEIHIRIVGIILIGLAILHVGFPKKFNWKAELASLSLLNRQMMQVHTLFIAIIVLFMGLLCSFEYKDVEHTDLGKVISLGLGLFWFLRLYIQLFYYSPSLWRGKTFETAVHVTFTVLWSYFSWVFICNYFS